MRMKKGDQAEQTLSCVPRQAEEALWEVNSEDLELIL